MTTIRQIERLWNGQQFSQLLSEMLRGRPEDSRRVYRELTSPLAAAAAVLIRLDELAQMHVPLYGRMLRFILSAQDPDGGWIDPMTTALCVRALLSGNGCGEAIDRGIGYLANLQKPDGLWPAEPLRRMPADPFVSAFVLLQLGAQPSFVRAVRFDAAVKWLDRNEHDLDSATRRLWQHASIRCFVHARRRADAETQAVLNWS